MPKKPDAANVLKSSVKYLRSSVAIGLAGDHPVKRGEGSKKAGLIEGLAVITRGEASGHGLWIDGVMLQQVADELGTSRLGAKSRFTHPGLSSDGMGKFIGRTTGTGQVDGDVVRGDLHFSQAAHETPDGDLAEYVMHLAEDDPGAFGTSIVFQHDFEAEDEFTEQHTNEDGVFVSPDPLNTNNLPHARLLKLRAVDVVDEPAANPDGLFHEGQEIAADAEALLAYALGLQSEQPAMAALDVDCGRVAGFVSRFLQRHGLELSRKEKPMKDGKPESLAEHDQPDAGVAVADEPTNETPTDQQDDGDQDQPQAEASDQADQEISEAEGLAEVADQAEQGARELCGQFIEAFGAENGGKWFAEGITFDQAKDRHIEVLQQQNEALQHALAEGRGEAEALGMGSDEASTEFDRKVDRFKGQNMGHTASVLAAGVRMANRNGKS